MTPLSRPFNASSSTPLSSRRCGVLGLVPKGSVSNSSTLQIFSDANQFWFCCCCCCLFCLFVVVVVCSFVFCLFSPLDYLLGYLFIPLVGILKLANMDIVWVCLNVWPKFLIVKFNICLLVDSRFEVWWPTGFVCSYMEITGIYKYYLLIYGVFSIYVIYFKML